MELFVITALLHKMDIDKSLISAYICKYTVLIANDSILTREVRHS